MRRVLVVSRNPAMAVGLQTPDNEIAEVRPGALPAWLNSHFEALDVVVLDLGRPEETAQALDLTRSLFPAIPVLAVAGPVPGWDAPVFSDAGVAVLELPVTRTRLLQAVAILGTDTAARTARLRHTSSVVFKQVPIEPRSEGPEVIDFNAPEPAGHVAPQEDRAAARAEELAEVEALEVLPAVEPPVVEEPHVVEEPAIVDGFPVAEECPVVEEPRAIAEPAAEQETPDIAPEHEPASLQPEPEPEPAEEAPETRALPEPSLRGVTPIAVSFTAPEGRQGPTRRAHTVRAARTLEPTREESHRGTAVAHIAPSERPREPIRRSPHGQFESPLAQFDADVEPPEQASAEVGAVDERAAWVRTAELVQALKGMVPELFGVQETGHIIVTAAVEQVSADAGALLVPDGQRWRVAGGYSMRPLEHRYELAADSWLVRTVGFAHKGVIIENTDIARQKLHGAPLASALHLLAVPIPTVGGILLLARQQDPPFDEDSLTRLVGLAGESGELLADSMDLRNLARVLREFMDEESRPFG